MQLFGCGAGAQWDEATWNLIFAQGRVMGITLTFLPETTNNPDKSA